MPIIFTTALVHATDVVDRTATIVIVSRIVIHDQRVVHAIKNRAVHRRESLDHVRDPEENRAAEVKHGELILVKFVNGAKLMLI